MSKTNMLGSINALDLIEHETIDKQESGDLDTNIVGGTTTEGEKKKMETSLNGMEEKNGKNFHAKDGIRNSKVKRKELLDGESSYIK